LIIERWFGLRFEAVLAIDRICAGPSGTLDPARANSEEPADAVRAVTAGERIAAPHAVDLECASALRGLTRGGKLASDESLRALLLLGRMNLRRYEHAPLLPRIWELRHNMWPYDACYVALAESLNATLVTIDRNSGAFPASGAPLTIFMKVRECRPAGAVPYDRTAERVAAGWPPSPNHYQG
jgi:predicted nucleic acid-binding protein